MKLKDRTAVVTGGARGIGLAVVKDMLAEGAKVMFCDIDEAASRDALEAVGTDDADCRIVDITSESECRRLIEETEERFGPVDILVNNARASVLKSLDATAEEWDLMLKVNIVGQVFVTRYAVESMKKTGHGGSIVNLGSISGVIAQPVQLTYAVTKAANIHMSRCLALDLKDDRIRVNTVSPGWVMTENVQDLLYNQWGWNDDRIKAEIGSQHLSGRLAEPEEIAKVISFLASDESSFVNGANIMADGGFTVV